MWKIYTRIPKLSIEKIKRTKARQPMVLTDTPGTAFDKISIRIMELLPTTEGGYSYILIKQDLLSKYLVTVHSSRQRQRR